MRKKIAVLAGDGIGTEVMAEAKKILDTVANKFGHEFEYEEALIGGAAYEKYKNHLPKETLKICEKSDAILFGSVGGPVDAQNEPKWKGCEKNSILGIRKYFNFNINLRPATVFKALTQISPLKKEIVGDGFEIMIIRELTGGIYFGKHETLVENGVTTARDEMKYDENEIRAIAKAAFEIAKKRARRLVSVDKANVLNTSILWRKIMDETKKEYPEVELTHMYIDNAAMQLIKNPRIFDTLVTENMFGDILSDLSSVFSGSLGLLGSASLNASGFGLYEPSGGSAPDIAGKGIANPIAQILSAAMMLKYSFSLQKECDAIYKAVEKTLDDGIRTRDICEDSKKYIGTEEMGNAIRERIQ